MVVIVLGSSSSISNIQLSYTGWVKKLHTYGLSPWKQQFGQ